MALHLPAEHQYHAVLRDVGSPPHPLGFEPDHKPHSVAMDRVADRPQAARRAVGGFRPLDGKAVIFAIQMSAFGGVASGLPLSAYVGYGK
jgi:hypothetical protein